MHADEYVLCLDKQRTSEIHQRSFSHTLYFHISPVWLPPLLSLHYPVSFVLQFTLTNTYIRTHTPKTFNDHNNPGLFFSSFGRNGGTFSIQHLKYEINFMRGHKRNNWWVHKILFYLVMLKLAVIFPKNRYSISKLSILLYIGKLSDIFCTTLAAYSIVSFAYIAWFAWLEISLDI